MKFDELRSLFLSSVSKVAKRPVKFPDWGKLEEVPEAPVQPSTDVPSESHESALVSLEDQSNPLWLAGRKGFSVGSFVQNKFQNASLENTYKLEGAEGSKLIVKQVPSYDATKEPHVYKLSVQEFLSGWNKTNPTIPFSLIGTQSRPPALKHDVIKCKIYQALLECDSMSEDATNLVFWRKPDQVRTGSVPVKQSKLVLAPITLFSSITMKSFVNAVSVGKFDLTGKPVQKASKSSDSIEFFLTAPPKPNVSCEDNIVPDASLMAAYWWVGTTYNKAEANVEVEMKEIRGISFPVLTNKKEIPPYSRLLKYVKSLDTSKAAPSKKSGAAPAKAGPPAKKSKTA